jgi:predicted CoA-binding protein
MMTAMAVGTERDLRPLFEPRSVAVVGASNDPAKWGQWLARGALRGEHRRSVFLVNRSGAEVLGRPTIRSLEELPEPPELVVLAVPASAFEETSKRHSPLERARSSRSRPASGKSPTRGGPRSSVSTPGRCRKDA